MHLPRRTCRIPLTQDQRRTLWLYALPGLCLEIYVGAVVVLTISCLALSLWTEWQPNGRSLAQLGALITIAIIQGLDTTAANMRRRTAGALKDLRDGHILVSNDQAVLINGEGIDFAISGSLQPLIASELPTVIPGRYYRVAFSRASRVVWSISANLQ